jgi:hypothetical protein
MLCKLKEARHNNGDGPKDCADDFNPVPRLCQSGLQFVGFCDQIEQKGISLSQSTRAGI